VRVFKVQKSLVQMAGSLGRQIEVSPKLIKFSGAEKEKREENCERERNSEN
jgi:late competence protein required for DNA uptake (superfamily II DNA/RNA helicase)